eukprot:scpid100526/ scgid8717/ Retrovirus-related Pol polyprotein LINE-1; Long interspersed element-1; Reverse transcriptase; Endonuclease
MFIAASAMRAGKKPSLTVHSQDGHSLLRNSDKADRVREHFASQFADPATTPVAPLTPRHLNNPITPSEISKAASRLRNRRACGPDNVPGELLKNATDELGPIIASLINTCIDNGTDMSSVIGTGTLIPLNKPNKTKGPVANMRPIILLNNIRKLLSLVVLSRISRQVSGTGTFGQLSFANHIGTS